MNKILIIEDDDFLRANLFLLLKAERFDVIVANHGVSGLDFAIELEPDLIFCDVNLPYLNGYEVLNELRKNSTTSNIPFIFIADEGNSADRNIALTLGASDYLNKPLSDEAVFNAIATYLPNYQSHSSRNQTYLKNIDCTRKSTIKHLTYEI